MNAEAHVAYDLDQVTAELLKTPISSLGHFHTLWDLHGACRRQDRARMAQLAGRLTRMQRETQEAV